MTPAPAKDRLLGVDAARGVALVGMMAVHCLSEKAPDGGPSLTQQVAVGRSAALFAVLAGVAIAFMTRRRRVRGPAAAGSAVATLLVRSACIGLVGTVVLGWVDADSAVDVILPSYAVMFLLVIPLVFLPTRAVFAAGAAVALLMPAVSLLLRDGLPEASGDNVSAASLLADPVGSSLEMTLTGTYPALVWVAYLAVGLGVGRLTLSSARVAGGLLGVGAVLAVGAPALSALLLGRLGGAAALAATGIDPSELHEDLAFGPEGVTPTGSPWWLASAAPHAGTPLDMLATIGSSLAVLGLILLLGRLGRVVSVLQAPLVAAGSMTLTLYTLHVAYVASPWFVGDSVPEYLAQVVVALAGALAWRRYVGRGPLEALVGRLAGAAARAGSSAAPPADPPTDRDAVTAPIVLPVTVPRPPVRPLPARDPRPTRPVVLPRRDGVPG